MKARTVSRHCVSQGKRGHECSNRVKVRNVGGGRGRMEILLENSQTFCLIGKMHSDTSLSSRSCLCCYKCVSGEGDGL